MPFTPPPRDQARAEAAKEARKAQHEALAPTRPLSGPLSAEEIAALVQKVGKS